MTPPRVAEARALQVARAAPGQRVLGVTLGHAQALAALAAERPGGRCVCWMLDAHRAALVEAELEGGPANLAVVCATDPPEGEVDLAVAPLSMRGEGELARETLQELAHRLAIGGVLVASSDNPRDTWLRQQMDALFAGVRMHRFDDAVVYAATKTRPLRRRRDFSCEFAFRDRERLVRAVTRPGVFSHRHVDPGARRLLEGAEVGAGERVVDIGCGSGVVALGLAARDPSVRVLAVDSHTRAVECAARGAALNQLTNVVALVNARGDYPEPGTYDLAITNPPYYADHAIAERMVTAAARSLRSGGRMLVVTKSPEWYEERLPEGPWGVVRGEEVKGYWLVRAERGEG